MMNANYLYNTIKNYYDNEPFMERVKSLRNQAISTTIKKGGGCGSTKIYVDFEDAYKAGQIDDETFEILYYFLRELSGKFLIPVRPHENFQYVFTVSLCWNVNPEELNKAAESLKEVLNMLWPEYSDLIHVDAVLDNPTNHTLRTTNLVVKTINRRLTDKEEVYVINRVKKDFGADQDALDKLDIWFYNMMAVIYEAMDEMNISEVVNNNDYFEEVCEMPEELFSHKFTQEEIEILQSGGKVTCSDFVSKTGIVYEASVTYNSEIGKFDVYFG